MIELIISVIIIAFILEFFDASAGMGYGTLTPILLLMGFSPLHAISAVIFTSAVLSLFTGLFHHGFKNINFLLKKNLRILSILLSFGIIAIIIGAIVSISIPEIILKIYIAILIMIIGIFIFIHKKKHKFSWKRLMFFASLASFNKGVSGGGYGPVLAGGQIISGVNAKHSVGITALSEGIISFIGFLTFLFLNEPGSINWNLISSLLIGGFISTPLAVYFVKKFPLNKLKYFIAIISIILGTIIIIKIFI